MEVIRLSCGMYTNHPLRSGSQPRLIAGSDRGPILDDRSCSGRKYHVTHPNTRNRPRSGFSPVSASWGEMDFGSLVEGNELCN